MNLNYLLLHLYKLESPSLKHAHIQYDTQSYFSFFLNIFPLNCKIIKKLKISKRLHDNIILKIVLFIIMILSQCNVRQSGGIRQDNQPPRQLTPNKDNLPPNEGNSPS